MPTTKNKLEQGLKDYLECEEFINDLFSRANFCVPNCISKPIGLYRERSEMPGDPTQFSGHIGCCPYNMFDSTNYPEISDHSVLDAQRVEKYSIQKKQKGACDYHSSSGCQLKTHKSPICVSWICDEFVQYLAEQKGINYPRRIIEEKLELILAGKESKKSVFEFKRKLKSMNTKIKVINFLRI